MRLEPFAVGVCSWSLKVRSIPELRQALAHVGTRVVQIACGDPQHATWEEGDRFPEVIGAANLELTGAMIGFAGEDYTTPQSIKQTGGFGNLATRAERLERLQWALDRTRALGLRDLSLHAGFLPERGDPARHSFLATLARVGELAGASGVSVAFETGQETAQLLRETLDELQCPHLGVNFDPANMLLYDTGDPVEAVQTLAPHIRSVHAKDAVRPTTPGAWGQEMPLGQGAVNIPRFVRALKAIGYRGPLCVEREAGASGRHLAEIATAVTYLRRCLAEP